MAENRPGGLAGEGPKAEAGTAGSGDFQLRMLGSGDLWPVLELERLAYAQPWTAENFIGEFQRRVTLPLGLERDGRLAAYLFFWLLPPEAHLLNVAVRPEYRRLGLARRLMEAMLSVGRRGGADKVYLEVRIGNQAALNLYESMGFVVAGRRPAYYEDGEDALLMTLELQ